MEPYGAAAVATIKSVSGRASAIADLLEVFLSRGVDAIINVDDNEAARREAEAVIAKCRAKGAMVRDHGMVPGLTEIMK